MAQRNVRFRFPSRVCTAIAFLTSLLLVALSNAQTKASQLSSAQPIANFTDIAEKAGITMQDIFGGVDTKKYII